MRLNPSFLATLVTLTALAACGTKGPLLMPPPAQPAAKVIAPPAPASASDNTNKATEPRL